MAPTIGAYMRQSPCDEKLKFLIFNKIFLLVPLHTLGKVQLCVSSFASLTVLLLNRTRMRKFRSFYFFTQHRKNVLCFMCFIFFCECSWLELTFLSRTNLKLVIQHGKNFTRQSRRENQWEMGKRIISRAHVQSRCGSLFLNVDIVRFSSYRILGGTVDDERKVESEC